MMTRSATYGGMLALSFMLLSAALHPILAVDVDLGSPSRLAHTFTRDYANAIDTFFPTFQAPQLEGRLDRIRKQYPAGFEPITIKSLSDIEKLFGLGALRPKAGQDFIATDSNAYRIDTKTGRIYFSKNVEKLPPFAFAVASQIKRQVAAEHLTLLKQIGIDTPQIFFQQTLFISHRSEANPRIGLTAVVTRPEPVVDSILTYALRSLDGIQVEESRAKISSNGLGKVVGLDVVWPRVEFHPGLKSFALKSRQAMKEEMLPLVRRLANGHEINLRMAVVLRPVGFSGVRYYIPALKVGLQPKDEEGETFYVDLVQQRIPYDRDDLVDNPGNRR